MANDIYGKPSRNGKKWDRLEVWQLVVDRDNGKDWDYIAWVLDRTASSCKSRYAMAKWAAFMSQSKLEWEPSVDYRKMIPKGRDSRNY